MKPQISEENDKKKKTSLAVGKTKSKGTFTYAVFSLV